MSNITDRVKKVLDVKGLSPSQLADTININRSRLSHILTGRNNPSLEIIQGILDSFPEINPDWMLSGKGSMLRQDIIKPAASTPGRPPHANTKAPNLDLFSYQQDVQKEKMHSQPVQKSDIHTENIENQSTNDISEQTEPIDEREKVIIKTDVQERAGRKVKMIMLYYDSNEYEVFYSSSN